MLTYDRLVLGSGGPWDGALCRPGLAPGAPAPVASIIARIERRPDAENLALTGGEPLAHPGLAAIGAAARAAGYRRILARTTDAALADPAAVDAAVRAGVSLFEVALIRPGGAGERLTARRIRHAYPGLRNLRRAGERSEALRNLYVAAVIPVCADTHAGMADLLDAVIGTLDLDRVILCWGDPAFPVRRAADSIARALQVCHDRQVWAVTRGIPVCAIPDAAAHLEELLVDPPGPAAPPPAGCAGCEWRDLCGRMPGAGGPRALEPAPDAAVRDVSFISDLVSRGDRFDAANAALHGRP